MDERDPREDDQMEDPVTEENLVDKSEDAEEFEDVEENDEEDADEDTIAE